MNLVIGGIIVVIATAVGVAAMLLVRRRAPEGSYFSDGDRASGVFGVVATGFSLLLGFIIFLAFTNYDSARGGAEQESLVVAQQVETAQFFSADTTTELTGELVCYARSVVSDEWVRMDAGTLGNAINPWAIAMFRTLKGVEPATASEQSAYDNWLAQTADRESARNDRVHVAGGIIPVPLWIVLFAIAAVIFVYMLFFADSGEFAITQALLMGTVVMVVTSLLLLLAFLDDPFHGGVGGLKPTAMTRTLQLMDEELGVARQTTGTAVPIPCDRSGGVR